MNVSFASCGGSSIITASPATCITYGSVTAGDVLVIQIVFSNLSAAVTGITGGGNTWVLANTVDVGTFRFETWWVASSLAATTTPIVTCSGTPSYMYNMYRISNISGATLGPTASLEAVSAANTTTLAPVTLASAGTAFTITRQTGSVFVSGWKGNFIDGDTNNLTGSSMVEVRSGYRLENFAFTASPEYTWTGSTTARSQTVAIYGTTTTTRWYPAVASPGIKMLGPCQGTWADGADLLPWTNEQAFYETVSTKYLSGNRYSLSLATNQQGNFDFHVVNITTPPLQAITLSGTFNLGLSVGCYWHDASLGNITGSNVARLKIHVYISTGSTAVPRTVLIDNHTESVDITSTTATYGMGTLLASPIAISGAVLEGDRIVVEIGIRMVSSPAPTPTYPPTFHSHIPFVVANCNVNTFQSAPDVVPDIFGGAAASWIEFSQILSVLAPTPPANDACADAITISSVPYQSSFIDTTGSADTNRAVWWTWVAPSTGELILHTLGSNYLTNIDIYTGSCGALVSDVSYKWQNSTYTNLRNFGYLTVDVVASTTYYIKVTQFADYARNHGGVLRFGIFYQENVLPQADDLYLHAGWLMGFRAGQPISFDPFFLGYATSGLAIDYSEKTLYPIYEDTVPHTAHRIVGAYHSLDGLEILDLATLNLNTSEIDYMYDWYGSHSAQIYITRDGIIYTGWFGNGYLYVLGAGTLPAQFNTISDNFEHTSIKQVDILWAENQPPYTFPAPENITVEVGPGAPWAFTVDETNSIIYYTTSGVYQTVVGGTGTDIIRRFNIATNTQMADFATVTLQGTHNTGLKGLRLLPDGGLIVANGTVVNRLNASGVVTQTYTPSNTVDHQVTVDVELNSDRTKFWMYDFHSTRVTQFNLETGAELFSFQPYLQMGSSVQIAVYVPTIVETPPTDPDISGIYYINPNKATKHDSYYNDVEKKIPDPTIRTSLLGE